MSSSVWLQLCLMSYHKCINQISFISRNAEKNVDAYTSAMLSVALGSAAEGGEVNQSPLGCLFSIINKKHQQAKRALPRLSDWAECACQEETVWKWFSGKEKCNCCRLVTPHSPFLFKSVFIRRNSPWSLFPNKPNSINCCCDAALCVDLLMTMCSHWILTASVLIDKGLPTRHSLLRYLGYT